MTQRIKVMESGADAMAAMYPIGKYLAKSSVEPALLDLVYFRVSQINGCAFCLDMHAKDLRSMGESEQRLYLLNAWREAPFYSKREKAALAWAEALTIIKDGQVPEAVYEEARSRFSEKELIDLTLGVMTINSYNRLNIAFGADVGSYQPGQFA
ncbi:carboxymuconolactone decarboxylase family protein [Taibaiella lutea]|uniref:Carboxymuconolactone decarboxylase family protein n=1 Tax=Taibaiella lutea TaxID=2608001 RepID=A0A5M6CEH1_9BACT|nr:carboxymuconolactone decarboxylase family protein [Taibaiella lutea]KAA5533564.1 carboxymuconolactone decarboxylase family protein [Taibaiella lutea]